LLVVLNAGDEPVFLSSWASAKDLVLVVILNEEKDLVLIVILNEVKDLVRGSLKPTQDPSSPAAPQDDSVYLSSW